MRMVTVGAVQRSEERVIMRLPTGEGQFELGKGGDDLEGGRPSAER